MARTRAGTAALRTIGGVATGTKTYQAALGLSELLILSRCANDKVPTVDILKSMVSYLAPFMADVGFSKVYKYIAGSPKRAYSSLETALPPGLTNVGSLG